MINPTILLRDTFSSDVAAGAVNGTTADDGSLRTSVDTSNYMSVTSGELTNSGSKANNKDPGYWNNTIIPLSVGTAVVWRLRGISAGYIRFGLSTVIDGDAASGFYIDPSFICINNNSVPVFAVGYPFSHKNFTMLIGASNRRFLLSNYSGSNILHFIYPSGSSVEKYAEFGTYSGRWGLDSILVAGYWLPTPLLSDGFGSAFGTSDGLGHAEGVVGGIGSGGGGKSLSGATWSNVGGKAINAPAPGSEIVTNGDFSNPASFGVSGDWSISGGKATVSAASGSALLWQTGVAVAGNWYRLAFDIDAISGTGQVRIGAGGAYSPLFSSVGGKNATVHATSATDQLHVQTLNGVSLSVQVDNASAKVISLSQLITVSNLTIADVYASVKLIIVSGFQAGLAFNWDNATTPTNGVVAYHDGTNVKLEKCVAGTWTTVFSTASTYSANAELVVSKIGTAYRVYYNNSLIGASTISDAGIISNTLHGIFSTDASNQLDDLVIYASGTGGEYADGLSLDYTISATERGSDVAVSSSVMEMAAIIAESSSDLLASTSVMEMAAIIAESSSDSLASTSVMEMAAKVVETSGYDVASGVWLVVAYLVAMETADETTKAKLASGFKSILRAAVYSAIEKC